MVTDNDDRQDKFLEKINDRYFELRDAITQLKAQVEQVGASQEFLNRVLTKHIEEEELLIKDIKTELLTGFPDADLKAHKNEHLATAEEKRVHKARIDEIITHALKNAVWAGLGMIAAALWLFLQ